MTAVQTHRLLVLFVLLAVATSAVHTATASTPEADPGGTQGATVVVEGLYDVGGHRLFMRCVGTGTPTIIYLHGYVWEGDVGGANSAMTVPDLVSKKYRFCACDRANLGRSDGLPGPLSGEGAVRDLHVLLAVAGIEPPYVLLGASFGGLLAYQYAVIYPDQVLGVLLLDAGFPDEFPLEAVFPPEERLTHDEWKEGREQIDELSVYEVTNAIRSNEPAIPVTYLLATPSNSAYGVPAHDDVNHRAMADYVARFSPGEIVEVPSQYWMEANVPEAIAAHLDALVAKTAD